MFKDAAPNLRLFPDYAAKKLRVQVNATAGIGNLLPKWSEVAQFSSPKEWEASEFAKKVASENWLEDLMWFWHDLADPSFPFPQPQAPA